MTAAWTPRHRARAAEEVIRTRVCPACGHLRRWHRPSLATVVAIACPAGGVNPAQLVSSSKDRGSVRARALAVWMLRSCGEPMDYRDIGAFLGGRDHSTCINLHQRAMLLRLTDRTFAATCRGIIATLLARMEIPHVCN